MKKSILNFAAVAAIVAVSLVSCNKEAAKTEVATADSTATATVDSTKTKLDSAAAKVGAKVDSAATKVGAKVDAATAKVGAKVEAVKEAVKK